jgi:hypothetical protein
MPNLPYISPSRMATAFRCGEQYRMSYEEGIKIPPRIVFIRGGSLHKTNEINLKQKQLTKKDMSLGDMQDATRDNFHKNLENGVFLAKEEVFYKNRILNDALNDSIALTELYKYEVAPLIPEPIEVEQDFQIFMDGLDIPLVGRKDARDKNGIRDLKVLGQKIEEEHISNELQPSFYGLAHAIETGEQEIKFTYDAIINIRQPYTDKVSLMVGQQHHAWIKTRIRAFLKMVKAGIYLPPAVYPAWVCTPKYCGYHGMCNYTK